MKKKEVLRRLSAISMAAMMTVTMIPSTAFAADEIFTDLETTADTEEDIQVTGDTEDTSEADAEVEEETPVTDEDDISGDVETEESGDSGAAVFTDDVNGAEEDTLFTAGENTPAADATVHMTVSVEGSLATAKDGTLMATRDVTVKDLDGNGILTYDEALAAAHDEYYNGGSAAGYGSATGDYGLNVTKLWGVETTVVGYWDNDVSCNSLSDEVKADDDLTAFVYKDKTDYSDAYTRFQTKSYVSYVNKSVTIFMDKSSWNGSLDKMEFFRSPDFTLSVYDENFKLVPEGEYGLHSGSAGKTVVLQKTGTYYLVASSTENDILVPTVAKVVVYG